jgi:nucleoside-diphosphate kinase
MAVQRTFSILKPDATKRNLTGAVNAVIEKAGLRIVAQKRIQMTKAQAETFYAVHSARPFFGELVEFMTSGPVVVQVLEGEDGIAKYREVMGATNPANAAEGTVRKLFALSVGENTVHGSDAPETAAIEIAQFFAGNEIVGGSQPPAETQKGGPVSGPPFLLRFGDVMAGEPPPWRGGSSEPEGVARSRVERIARRQAEGERIA